MNYISINLYRKLIDQALIEGMVLADFKDLPFLPADMKEVRAVPADAFFELHEMLDQRLDPGFSVRIGQQMKMDDYGVLGMSWKTCSKVGEIFERSERYFQLLSNTYVFKVEREDEISKIYLYRDAYRRGVELSNEATFSATVVVLQAITETDIAPLSISFKHGVPKDLKSYEDCFKCPVFFNQAQNFMAYKTAELEARTAKADSSINKFLVERVAEETKGIEISSVKIATDVESLIKDALPSGIPGITEIARHMGMSSRTLSRRLSANGITFRELISRTQENFSKHLLRNTTSSIGEIAFQTGFSEQSAFNRAFKRWTSQSPTAFRQN